MQYQSNLYIYLENAILDPFISIAQEKYPSLTVDEGLDSLKYEIELIKNKTIGLENYISERKLSQSQIDRMKQILDANPKGPVIISCVANVPEAYSYAKQIYDTFKNSNWDIKGINTTQFFSDPHRGLVIKINDPNNIPQHVKTIEKLLSFLDINAKGQHSKKVPVGALEILIGFKN
ncbi:MAG: hypothetical protein H8D22_07490 [Candidatus Cloacimonetes bacterium]|nr:hypothetical protein [Candidatus Cloacimonadota bacterium]